MYGERWHAKALAVKRAAGFRCEYVYKDGSRCQCTRLLDCHHVTYRRFRCERGSDLVCLCRMHHAKIHGKLGGNRNV